MGEASETSWDVETPKILEVCEEMMNNIEKYQNAMSSVIKNVFE